MDAGSCESDPLTLQKEVGNPLPVTVSSEEDSFTEESKMLTAKDCSETQDSGKTLTSKESSDSGNECDELSVRKQNCINSSATGTQVNNERVSNLPFSNDTAPVNQSSHLNTRDTDEKIYPNNNNKSTNHSKLKNGKPVTKRKPETKNIASNPNDGRVAKEKASPVMETEPSKDLRDWFSLFESDDESVFLQGLKSMLAENPKLINSKTKNGLSALHRACSGSHEQAVRLLLQLGADINMQSNTGETPLLSAIFSRHYSVAMALIDRRECDVNISLIQEGYSGTAPIHLTCYHGNHALFRRLLDAGADPSRTHSAGRVTEVTCLHDAALGGDMRIASDLLTACADGEVLRCDNAGIGALHRAAGRGHAALVQALLDAGAAVDCAGDDGRGTSTRPLHLACENGHLDTVRHLVEAGADVNLAREVGTLRGVTPLQLAASRGHTPVISLLVSETACRLDAQDSNGMTALHLAVSGAHTRAVRLLVERDCSLEACAQSAEVSRQTPLLLAAKTNNHKLVSILVKAGANVNAQEILTDTKTSSKCVAYSPLHWAAYNGNEEMAKLFLDHGAEIDSRAALKLDSDVTPLHVAAVRNRPGIIKLLAGYECDIETCMCHGFVRNVTALHQAAYCGHAEALLALLDLGASVDALSGNGFTPLVYSVQRDHADICRLLLKNNADPHVEFESPAEPSHLIDSVHLATMLQHRAVLKVLVSGGADINRGVSVGGLTQVTCLHRAASRADSETTSALLELGADPSARASDGATALHWAAGASGSTTIELLVRAGAVASVRAGPHGCTPLHVCAQRADACAMRALLNCADITAASSIRRHGDEATPLHVAAERAQSAALINELMCGAGCDVEARDSSDATPLHRAAAAARPLAVGELIACGCDVNARTRSGLTALRLAKRRVNEGGRDTVEAADQCLRLLLDEKRQRLARSPTGGAAARVVSRLRSSLRASFRRGVDSIRVRTASFRRARTREAGEEAGRQSSVLYRRRAKDRIDEGTCVIGETEA